jgi:hypothetical protein
VRVAGNRNSSRFGKLMQIWTSTDASGALNASSIETYLLEKGRVSHHAQGEQTFHALYYLAAAAAAARAGAADHGIDADTLPWLVGHAAPLQLLQPSASSEPAAASPPAATDGPVAAARLAAFGEVRGALLALGAPPAEVGAAWAVLGAILALGELSVHGEAADGSVDDEGKAVLSPESAAPLDGASAMLGVDGAILRTRLLSRTIVSGRGSNFIKPFTVAEARAARDGLCHALYERLFRWLVGVVNTSLGGGAVAGSGARCIAILDIFGFERLETNALEQLLINHTNERLQLYVRSSRGPTRRPPCNHTPPTLQPHSAHRLPRTRRQRARMPRIDCRRTRRPRAADLMGRMRACVCFAVCAPDAPCGAGDVQGGGCARSDHPAGRQRAVRQPCRCQA